MKINGKDVLEILEALAVPKRCEKYLEYGQNKYPYHAIAEYQDRMNSVIGKNHYSLHYDECRMMELPTGQYAYVIKCTITVYDDDWNPVPCLAAEGYGSCEIKMAKDKEKYLLLNNIPMYARMASFKDACRGYGIFGEKDVEEANSKSKETASNRTDSSYNRSSDVALETYLTDGKMRLVRTDGQSGKPVYELSCYKKCGGQLLQTKYSVVFYPNQYKKEEKKIDEFILLLEDGKQHLVKLKTSPTSRTNGLVFKGFK